MEVFFRRAALACWSSILLLVVALAAATAPVGHLAGALPRPRLIDAGTDLALEQAAAIKAADAAPPAAVPAGTPSPGRLLLPSIGVDAPVRPVGLDSDGAMGVTSHSYDVGWYSPGVAPGNPGDAVIDGHLDWYDTSQAVFFNLKQVHRGDTIEVQRLDGVTKTFRVTSVTTVAYNASVPGLFVNSGPPRLTLITCGGAWDQKLGQYLERVIVDADLVA